MEGLKRLQYALMRAGYAVDAEEYAVKVGVVAAIAAGAAYFTFGAGAGLVTLATTLFGLLALPFAVARRREDVEKAEAPFFVLDFLALEGVYGTERALREAAEGYTAIRKIVDEVLRTYGKGIPLERALMNAVDDREGFVKRAFREIALMHVTGRGREKLERMAEEQLREYRMEARRFASQLAVYSMLFIAVSALAPALYEMYTVLGAVTLGEGGDPLAVAVFAPVLSALSLAVMYARTPPFLRGEV